MSASQRCFCPGMPQQQFGQDRLHRVVITRLTHVISRILWYTPPKPIWLNLNPTFVFLPAISWFSINQPFYRELGWTGSRHLPNICRNSPRSSSRRRPRRTFPARGHAPRPQPLSKYRVFEKTEDGGSQRPRVPRGTRIPFSPSVIASGMAFTRDATHAFPRAIASSTAPGSPPCSSGG